MERTDFEAFWELYPRKTAKKDAFKAWGKLDMFERKRALDGVVVLAASRVGSDPLFIPYPATWLNGHRWEDQPVEPALEADAPTGRVVGAGRPEFLAEIKSWERPTPAEQTEAKRILDDYFNRMFSKLTYWERARVRHSRKQEMDPPGED